jgi:LacI family transcriptional regulator
MSEALGKRRSNLKDVARKSGVSVATVSRVLNSPEKVSSETRERVLSAIEELRFVRSAAARAINTGRSRVVGALIPTLDNAIFARVLDGLEGRLAHHKLSLIVATTDDDPVVEAQKAQELIDIGAEGLIVSGIHHDVAFEKLVDRVRLPIVGLSYYSTDYHLPTVGYDNYAIAQMALRYLCELNHTNIAIIHGPRWNNDRTRARITSLENAEMPVHLDYYEVGIAISEGCAAVSKILESGTPYTAYLCLSDVLATGAIYELQRNGLNVPGDISVTGMEDLPSSSYIYPSLTTVRLPVLEMGINAAEALANWLDKGDRPESLLLPSELMKRQSTAAVSK